MSYTIFANHAHVSPAHIRPGGTVEKLKELMDACGIAKAVCFAPFAHRLRELGDPQNQNQWLANEIAGDSRLAGFGTIDFSRADLTAQTEEIAALGLRGIKIHPAAQEISIVGEQAFEVYEAAQRLGLFLSFHTGIHWHRIKDYQPILFDEVAWHFPQLRFSMEHIGGYHFFREALAVICNNREEPYQVYAGWTSISNPENGLPGAWSLSDDELRTVIHQTGSHRSIFGLDFPFRDAATIQADIARIVGLDIPEEAKAAILGGTLEAILNG